MKEIYLAIDLGASSGRHIVGYKNENDELVLDEVFRFKNSYSIVNNHKIWDIDFLFKEYAEHALPVGVPGSRDLLGLQIVPIHRGKQLGIRHIEIRKINFLFGHSLFTSLSR